MEGSLLTIPIMPNGASGPAWKKMYTLNSKIQLRKWEYQNQWDTQNTWKQSRNTDRYLSAWCTGWLYLGGEGKGVHAKWSKHGPHLLPVSCKWIPGRNNRLHWKCWVTRLTYRMWVKAENTKGGLLKLRVGCDGSLKIKWMCPLYYRLPWSTENWHRV